MSVLKNLFSFFGRPSAEEEAEARANEEILRQKIVQRCTLFRRLLARNKNALERMSELEAHLTAGKIDLNYVQGTVRKISSSVSQMVEAFLALASGKYGELSTVVARIEGELEERLAPVAPVKEVLSGPLVL